MQRVRMTALCKRITSSLLAWVAIGIGAIAVAVLLSFPADPVVWQLATWTLVAALVALLVLVPASGYALAKDRAARTWPRIVSFAVGLGCLVAVAIAAI